MIEHMIKSFSLQATVIIKSDVARTAKTAAIHGRIMSGFLSMFKLQKNLLTLVHELIKMNSTKLDWIIHRLVFLDFYRCEKLTFATERLPLAYDCDGEVHSLKPF